MSRDQSWTRKPHARLYSVRAWWVSWSRTSTLITTKEAWISTPWKEINVSLKVYDQAWLERTSAICCHNMIFKFKRSQLAVTFNASQKYTLMRLSCIHILWTWFIALTYDMKRITSVFSFFLYFMVIYCKFPFSYYIFIQIAVSSIG